MAKRALISVWDKTGIVELSKGLISLGFDIVSTGGTAKLLQDSKVACTDVSAITGFDECLDGRVKTLHPIIHAGLLADRHKQDHMDYMSSKSIDMIDVVVVNLYPFKQTISRQDCTYELAIENIDIGGPTMLRSAAKNHASVYVVCDPQDYTRLIEELKAGDKYNNSRQAFEFRKLLAYKAYAHTASYDSLVSNWFAKHLDIKYPDSLTLTYDKISDLRYGENSHQSAAYYQDALQTFGLPKAKFLGGKELSFNNINDANGAIALLAEFDTPAVVAIKHTNPCGVATNSDINKAYDLAYKSDPISIFGGIVAINRKVDKELATKLNKLFLEIVIAPEFDTDALEVLKKKANLRILQLQNSDLKPSSNCTTDHIKKVNGGIIIQGEDNSIYDEQNVTIPTAVKPTDKDLEELRFAYIVAKHTKSNAIVLTKNMATIGVGVGQTSRIKACQQALLQAGEKAKDAYLASDAFFPFDDCVTEAANSGIKSIVQPGGSKNDKDSITACDKHNISMIFVGQRHFKH